MKLSCVVLTRSEKVNDILIANLAFGDEIIVLHDAKKLISDKSESKKVKHLYHPLDSNFSEHRNFALNNAKGEWVIFVDEDEYVGKELKEEIITTIVSTKNSGFKIPRRDVVFYDEVKYGEVGNAKFLRLAKRNSGKFSRPVHEVWNINGEVGEMKNFLYHRKDNFISEFFSRMIQYSPIDSATLDMEGKTFSYFRLFMYPLSKFCLNYVFKKGFLDGHIGLFQAYLMSIQSLSNRVFQWELMQKQNS